MDSVQNSKGENEMKTYTYLVLAAILILILSACGGGQAQSKELNLYAWSEYIPQALLDGFTEQTGIKVNYDTYSSNEEPGGFRLVLLVTM
jgi:spermidine/putrescine transport system substrate-binding protein